MTKILLILSALFVVACGEKVSTDTVQLSKTFMKALLEMDEKSIEKIKHPKDGGKLNVKRSLQSKHTLLKEKNITLDELKYTVQKGPSEDIECVVVQSNGTREGNGNLPMISWRLKFNTSDHKEGLLLKGLDASYGYFKDKGCRR